MSTETPFAPTRFADPDIAVEALDDGGVILTSRDPLGSYPVQTGEWLRHWSAETPDATCIATRRPAGDWQSLSYAETRRLADRLSQALLDIGLGSDRPLAFLSEKSLYQGLLTLAAMQVGIPAAPISPAYSLIAETPKRLNAAMDAAVPGAIYVEDAALFADALREIAGEKPVIAGANAEAFAGALPFEKLVRTMAGDEVDRAFAKVSGSDIAKILFTSGSTGQPKAVPNTHEMLCSNQQALAQVFPFLEDRPPVVVDWQPWHHAGGACFNWHATLRNGGAYYIDHGKPTEDGVAETIRNLRDISPTIHFNVPRGYIALLPYLEADADLRDGFFRDLDVLVYAAASMPPEMWARMDALSVAARGSRIPFVSAWGMTELAPLHTVCHWPMERAGEIGVPVPGCEVRLDPVEDRYEIRCRGPNVFKEYLGRPELNLGLFDGDGFFRTGDSVHFNDPDDANKGLMYDGRLVEEFKMTTGTWVPVGELRVVLIEAGAPFVRDVVIAGEGREEIGLLIFPEDAAVVKAGGPEAARKALAEAFARHNEAFPAATRRVGRFLFLGSPASLDAGEITDKGYVNQRAVLKNRADDVARLYDGTDDDIVRL